LGRLGYPPRRIKILATDTLGVRGRFCTPRASLSDIGDMTDATCPTRPTRWANMTDAAAELGVSTRTVQRHVAKGKLQGRTVDGRTLVAMPSDATPGTVGAVVAGVQQQVETTDRLATSLLVVAEQNVQLTVARAERAERSVASLRRIAVAACVLGVAGVAWAVATGRQASDTQARMDATQAVLTQQAQALAAATRDRQVSQDDVAVARAERDALVVELTSLRSLLSDTLSGPDDCLVASSTP